MGVPVWRRELAFCLTVSLLTTTLYGWSTCLSLNGSRHGGISYIFHSAYTIRCTAINFGDSLIPNHKALLHYGKGHPDDRYQATRRNANNRKLIKSIKTILNLISTIACKTKNSQNYLHNYFFPAPMSTPQLAVTTAGAALW